MHGSIEGYNEFTLCALCLSVAIVASVFMAITFVDVVESMSDSTILVHGSIKCNEFILGIFKGLISLVLSFIILRIGGGLKG